MLVYGRSLQGKCAIRKGNVNCKGILQEYIPEANSVEDNVVIVRSLE